ncbi:hypothetical protein GGS24DRAFT_511757 [Hypoxylon argillaceum]|nr:hypothetical protein GGS24DRAFT_511757 [Hypoxylon argillaceum]
MNPVPTIIEPTVPGAGWQAFAVEHMMEEAAVRARYEQLYPLQPRSSVHQPTPIHFYGPGPDGRVQPHDPPVGTLHFARWRHELAATEHPDIGGDYYEESPQIVDGRGIRPTYTTKRNESAKEVDHFRWERVAADSMKGVRTFPGPESTRKIHDEYLLNEDDFNDPDAKRPKVLFNLNNRLDEDPKDIYPLGYKLLKRWSKANGHKEWEDGGCLGADPQSPKALTKHLGWFPKRLRIAKAGLGADPQDGLWNEVFHGNLDAKPKTQFLPPKKTWSEDSSKVTTLASSMNSCNTLHILSLKAVKASLPQPESDTLVARDAWLGARNTKEYKYKLNKVEGTDHLATSKLSVTPSVHTEGMNNTEPTKNVEDSIETTENYTTPTEGSETTGSEKSLAIIQKVEPAETPVECVVRGSKMAARDAADEEREAIAATLEELSRNPEPGLEGKRPIVVYLAFRSNFLGVPVTQVLGYKE